MLFSKKYFLKDTCNQDVSVREWVDIVYILLVEILLVRQECLCFLR